MKAEVITGYLKAVDGENLTIFTRTHNPEGEILTFPSEGLSIDERWFRTWRDQEARYMVIDGVVKEVSEG